MHRRKKEDPPICLAPPAAAEKSETDQRTVSQIPKFQGGVIVTNGSTADQTRWSYSVTGSISPSALFESAAERKQYSAFYKAHKIDLDHLDPVGSIDMGDDCMGRTISEPDQKLTPECMKELASSKIPNRILLAFLPKVDVKAFTAFDYTKTGASTFFALPEINKPIYDVTLTWDLRATVPSIQNRADAATAFEDSKSMKTTQAVQDKNDLVW